MRQTPTLKTAGSTPVGQITIFETKEKFVMATESETKGFNRVMYNSLLQQLELEKILSPETFATALRVAARMRKNFVDYAGEDSFEPLPQLPPKNK